MTTLRDVIQYFRKIEEVMNCCGASDSYCRDFQSFQESLFRAIIKETSVESIEKLPENFQLPEKSLKIFEEFRGLVVNHRFNT